MSSTVLGVEADLDREIRPVGLDGQLLVGGAGIGRGDETVSCSPSIANLAARPRSDDTVETRSNRGAQGGGRDGDHVGIAVGMTRA